MIRTVYAALAAFTFWISDRRIASAEKWHRLGEWFDARANGAAG